MSLTHHESARPTRDRKYEYAKNTDPVAPIHVRRTDVRVLDRLGNLRIARGKIAGADVTHETLVRTEIRVEQWEASEIPARDWKIRANPTGLDGPL